MQTSKKKYQKPGVVALGSVKDVTGWTAGGAGEMMGGVHKGLRDFHGGSRGKGPADCGS